MTSHTPSEPEAHTPVRSEAIEQAVADAASEHLQAPDADTALSYYAPKAVVASDGRLYESFETFAQDVRAFYESLHEVHVAAWHEPRVQVLSDHAAVFTATVRWASTDTAGVRLDLRGVWTAVWLRRAEGWRIAVRHESFMPAAGEPDAAV